MWVCPGAQHDAGSTDEEGWQYATETKEGIWRLCGREGHVDCGSDQGINMLAARPLRQLRCRRWSRLCLMAGLPKDKGSAALVAAHNMARFTQTVLDATAATAAAAEQGAEQGKQLAVTAGLAAVSLGPGEFKVPDALALEWSAGLALRLVVAEGAVAAGLLAEGLMRAQQEAAEADQTHAAAVRHRRARCVPPGTARLGHVHGTARAQGGILRLPSWLPCVCVCCRACMVGGQGGNARIAGGRGGRGGGPAAGLRAGGARGEPQ